MKDLLKEAIVEAKAVRETALANAKLALEEAFAPRLQSIISAKMNEMEEEEDQEEDVIEEPVEAAEEMPAEETPETEESEEDFDFEESEEEDDDAELDEIIRELESDEADAAEVELEEMESEEEVDLDEIINSLREEEMDSEEEAELEEEMADDEEVDLDEIVSSLREEDEEVAEEEAEDHSAELEEAYNVITYLKSKLTEVNILNAKLLYSNKLFKSFNLSDSQKMKVIENFDRANTMREIKLIYTTLTESFKAPVAKKVVKEGFASKPVASTRPNNATVLTEGNEQANRFKKLAGLL